MAFRPLAQLEREHEDGIAVSLQADRHLVHCPSLRVLFQLRVAFAQELQMTV